VADLNVTVNYLPEIHDPLPQISDYVESIRISLWDTVFYREFNAEKGVHNNNTPEKQMNFGPALKRVLYRYFKFVLFLHQAISKSPAFFTNYKDTESEDNMYTRGILNSWNTVHLETCGWYLDCPFRKPPTFEIALRDSLEPSLKTNEPTRPVSSTKDASKKMKEPKPKEPKPKEPKPKEPKCKAIIVDDSNEDRAVLEAPLHESVEVTSSPDEPPSKKLRENPTPISPIVKQTPNVEFVTPPKRKSMLATTGLTSKTTLTMEMIINDSFVRIIEEKTLTKCWPAPYDDILAFLSKVQIQIIPSCKFYISSHFHLNSPLIWLMACFSVDCEFTFHFFHSSGSNLVSQLRLLQFWLNFEDYFFHSLVAYLILG
jgi:hypothetical protein